MFIPLTKGAAPMLKNACVHLVLKLLIRMYCAISTQVAFVNIKDTNYAYLKHFMP